MNLANLTDTQLTERIEAAQRSHVTALIMGYSSERVAANRADRDMLAAEQARRNAMKVLA